MHYYFRQECGAAEGGYEDEDVFDFNKSPILEIFDSNK